MQAPDLAQVGALHLDHVGFSYGAGSPVLVDVSAEVRPGEMVAVIGASGSRIASDSRTPIIFSAAISSKKPMNALTVTSHAPERGNLLKKLGNRASRN